MSAEIPRVKQHILVTGGAGYIGTHTLVELHSAGYRTTILDNLDNSCLEALNRVRAISQCSDTDMTFVNMDLMNLDGLDSSFSRYGPFDACIHFAGLKAVGESVALPLHYYANNFQGSVNLIHCLDKYGCRNLVFSSSATVYGDPEFVPLTEDHPLRSTNPYGKTKLFIEEMLRDMDASMKNLWDIALLRYFNPIGAHSSGRIGEDPKGIPNNLVPFVSQVAIGRREKVSVFGNDYDTKDGTGVRDYIHVVDLAKGHVAAVKKVISSLGYGSTSYNLGTGKGSSVLEVIAVMKKVSGKTIDYVFTSRRSGDIATCYANAAKAANELGWTAKLTLEDGIRSAWKWQNQNPDGYRTLDEIKEESAAPRKGLVFQLFGDL